MKRLAVALLLLTAAPCAAKDARAILDALASHKPFVLIAVPEEYLAVPRDREENEAAYDYAFYVSDWGIHSGKNERAVVVPLAAYRAAIRSPEARRPCATLFVRPGLEAAMYSPGCIYHSGEYEAGARWMHAAKAPLPKDFTTVRLVPR